MALCVAGCSDGLLAAQDPQKDYSVRRRTLCSAGFTDGLDGLLNEDRML